MNPIVMYREGSEALRNYSRLTMSLRTLAYHILAATALAFSIFWSQSTQDNPQHRALIVIGLILATASCALTLVNWHFQSAFDRIRDWLAKVEQGDGPWSEHQRVRKGSPDRWATYFPHILIGIWGVGIACFASILGAEHGAPCWPIPVSLVLIVLPYIVLCHRS